MKKIYLSIFTALAGLSLNAQTLTDTNHSPANGDMYSTWQCDSTAISAGASGAGATWNFAAIATHSSVVNSYTGTTNANASYPTPGVQLSAGTNKVAHYKSSSTNLTYWGGDILVGTTPATLVYTASAVSAAYPMALNTTSSAATAGSITVLAQNGTFTGNSSVIADGTGTLILPSGTYSNAIRVVSTQTITFSASFAAGTVTQKNWDYFDAGSIKEAWFSITTSTVVLTSPVPSTSTQTVVTRRNPAITTGINTNAANITNMVVFPNPSNTTVNFVTENTEAKNITVYDVTGKLVTKQTLTDGKLTLDVSNYTTGLYMYSVIGNNNQTLKSGKITVSH